jgi:hypothetical protein
MDQPLRIVICGEVSSGKSTVLNAVLREALLPDNLGSGYRPLVFARHSAAPGFKVTYADGHSAKADNFDDPSLLRDAIKVSMFCDKPHLAGVELIELPLTKAEDLSSAQLDLVASADVMIWVTIASQAWRLTEKTIVDQLGAARPKRCILAVSRADKLRNGRDRLRLRERMIRETSDIFGHCVFVFGSRRDIAESSGSAEVWAKTGGAEISALIDTFRAEVAQERPVPVPVPVPLAEKVIAFLPHRAAAAAPRPLSGLMGELSTIANGLIGVEVIGLIRQNQVEPIMGDAARCSAVGDACLSALSAMAQAFAPNTDAGPVTACVLSTGAHWLLFQDVPEIGLVFMLSDARTMRLGTAQSALARMCRSCEEAA